MRKIYLDGIDGKFAICHTFIAAVPSSMLAGGARHIQLESGNL